MDNVMTKDRVAELDAWIRDWISRELTLDLSQITPSQQFVAYGMDSLHAMMLVGDLEEYLGRRLSPTLAWSYPTVDSMGRFLADLAAGPAPATDAEILARLDEMSEEEVARLLEQKLLTEPS
jgi:acyl carrier protein